MRHDGGVQHRCRLFQGMAEAAQGMNASDAESAIPVSMCGLKALRVPRLMPLLVPLLLRLQSRQQTCLEKKRCGDGGTTAETLFAAAFAMVQVRIPTKATCYFAAATAVTRAFDKVQRRLDNAANILYPTFWIQDDVMKIWAIIVPIASPPFTLR